MENNEEAMCKVFTCLFNNDFLNAVFRKRNSVIKILTAILIIKFVKIEFIRFVETID